MSTRQHSASELARALKGKKSSNGWMALCPAHDDSTPSLAISTGKNGKPLFKCHAGCGQDEVIAALIKQGHWSPSTQISPPPSPQPSAKQQRKKECWKAIWSACQPAYGTIVADYLASRGLHLDIPPDIGFARSLRTGTGGRLPAMVALIRDRLGNPSGIHRTFLDPNGRGKAKISPNKKMLGQVKEAAVHLAPAGETLLIGEGIETCLSAYQASGLPTWAALSAGNMASIKPPEGVSTIIVLADNDEAGMKAAVSAAEAYAVRGLSVRIATPPAGHDFNDVLTSGGEK